MHPLLKIIINLPLMVYYVIEDIIMALIHKKLRYKSIDGETVIVTGAGSGIGRALALEFANCGTRLVLLDIDMKGLQKTQELVAKKSCKNVDVFLYECDLSKRDMVYSIASRIKDEVGVVNILVNNAGVITGKQFLDCSDAMIQKTIDVNTMAHFWTCKAFLPDMKVANRGHLVFVSSLCGFMTFPRMADYSASKHAIVGFEDCLNQELEEEGYTGIKTTVVAPFFVQTGLFNGFNIGMFSPLTPEWVAKQIISGVLADQEVLIVPHWFKYFVLMKALMTRKVWRKCLKLLYSSDPMSSFQGRKID